MKILVLGKNGQVGGELQRALSPLGALAAPGRAEVDLSRIDQLRAALQQARPDIIVNAAAYTAVDKAESETERTQIINADAPGAMAEEAKKLGALFVHYSTDYVFDGEKASPYVEDDPTSPLSAYGKTKLAGEQAVRQSGAPYLIFRTSWVYAARGANFARTMLRLAGQRDSLRVVADQHGAPTSAELIADVTALALYRARQAGGESLCGLYHLAASGETSWHGYAGALIAGALRRGMPLKTGPDTIQPISTAEYPTPAKRPRNSRLSCAKLEKAFGLRLPHWEHHVNRLLDQWAAGCNSA